MGRCRRRKEKRSECRCGPPACSCERSRLRDTEEEDSFLEPIDTEEEDSFLEPIDTEEEDSFLEPIDTEEEDSFLEPIDTEEEDSFLEPIDTSGNRRRAHGAGALCGDYPSGRPGNVRRGARPRLSGHIIVRLAPHLALAPGNTLEELAQQAGLDGLLSVLEHKKYELTGRSRRLVARRGSTEAQRYADEIAGTAPPAAAQTPVGQDPDEQDVIDFSPAPKPVTPEEIVALEATVENSPLAPLHSLATYWRLDANHKPGKWKKILKRLNQLTEVSLAYPEMAVSDPAGDAEDPFAGAQTYLDRAPFGIDAAWARRHGGDGSGVALVDMEQGWIPSHPELVGKQPALIHGNNRHGKEDYRGDHGTAVLGEIAAADNGFGVRGIAPGVDKIGLASHFHDEPENGDPAVLVTTSESHVAEAIYAAIGHLPDTQTETHEPFLKPGDVLLIEAQRGYLPTEVDPADFDAIRLASALGIIVVEAAGNGGRDLDAYRDARGAIFNRRSGSFCESGAIMVGAALSALPHNRKRTSNFGSRVDCYAWGDRVVTCGYGDLHTGGGPNDAYTADFSNTSAAAPIIAGAALILQGMYQEATRTGSAPQGRRLMPGQMRALLADPATGTRQGRRVRGHIGAMPNLRAIVENTLRIVPDVYLRDRVGDTGSVPARHECCSPDVFVTQKKAAFGEGSGKENDPGLGSKIKAGEDNMIVVRMKNRGRLAAKRMTATVYRAPVATLVTPEKWTEIGRSRPVDVPQGDTLVVAEPFAIRERNPNAGFYCLIALVEGGDDPTRLPPGLLAAEGARARRGRRRPAFEPPRFDWHAYRVFLRSHNHLAFRNLHVVDDLKPGPGINGELDFSICGTPEGDRGRFFDLEVFQQLPEGAELCLDVPLTLAPALHVAWEPEVVEKQQLDGEGNQETKKYLRYCLPALPRFPFCRVPLAAGTDHACSFVVRGIEMVDPGGNAIAIRQLFRGQEVGRVSFVFKAN